MLLVEFEGVEVRLVEEDMEFEILGFEELPVIVHELVWVLVLLLVVVVLLLLLVLVLVLVLLLIGLMDDSSTIGYKRSPGPTKITA